MMNNIARELIRLRLGPIDKTDLIDKGMLDLVHGRAQDTIDLVNSYPREKIGDDIYYLGVSLQDLLDGRPLHINESAKLKRSYKMYGWKTGAKIEFIEEGSLKNRKICDNPEIANWSQRELLNIPRDETTQFASMAVIMGDRERLLDAPYKLKVAYDAVDHWEKRRAMNLMWVPMYDQTILSELVSNIEKLKYGKTNFRYVHSENYMRARCLGIMGPKDAEKKLQNQESPRIDETEKMIEEVYSGKEITSKDHRVVFNGVFLQLENGMEVKVRYKSAVNKTFPQFWKYVSYAKRFVISR